MQVGPHCLSRVLDIRVFPCEGSSCTFSHDGEEEKTDEAPTAAGDDVASDPESGQGWYWYMDVSETEGCPKK